MTRMDPTPTLSVILAATHDHPGLPANVDRFLAEVGPEGRVVVASPIDLASGVDPRVRLVRTQPGRLAPQLWRAGLVAIETPLVAFSTTQMSPRPGWLAGLVDGLARSGVAGIGGPIEPGRRLSATDRAVALLRYSAYFPTAGGSSAVLPPGENSLYRRDRLDEVRSSWLDGFWEVEVQRDLLARGHELAMSPSSLVTFEGGSGLTRMAGQRFRHALRYGRFRSSGLGPMARLARLGSTPFVPPLLLARAASNLRRRGLSPVPWLAGLPSLAVLASTWAVGEACGVLQPIGGAEVPEDPRDVRGSTRLERNPI